MAERDWDQMQAATEKLLELLRDRQPRLAIWRMAVNAEVEEIAASAGWSINFPAEEKP